ncbi:hypothetical protein ZWY2020_020429 [Hordeum vulgare]|nr:hypothetical protein ZWY2020_020429 [Hordeum vulgare]
MALGKGKGKEEGAEGVEAMIKNLRIAEKKKYVVLGAASARAKTKEMDRVMKLASERAVVVFTLSPCCMCHTVERLFRDQLRVNALVHELDQDPRGKEMERALLKMLGRGPSVPAVFIGGKLVGGTNRIMSLHLGGELVPMLKNAGALWL